MRACMQKNQTRLGYPFVGYVFPRPFKLILLLSRLAKANYFFLTPVAGLLSLPDELLERIALLTADYNTIKDHDDFHTESMPVFIDVIFSL